MTSLLEAHDVLLLDLDGTLFRGATPIPGAVEMIARSARDGHQIGYLTNNGSRSPREVAAHLTRLGFEADESEVVTSGQAAGRLLAERLPAGASVLVIGTEDLRQEVRGVGLNVTDTAEDADAVVQGHSPETAWPLLAEGCLAIRAGALWVACNVDTTLPTERGELPGNGSMVAALRTATGAEPLVAGKPEPWLYTEAVRRTGARRALMIGDRLDTDMAGAHAAGLPSLAVLTGVSGPGEMLRAVESERPTYIGADLRALDEDIETVSAVAAPPWKVTVEGAELVLSGDGTSGPYDEVAALRGLCGVHWARGGGAVTVRAGDGAAAEALLALGLSAD
ncbi:MAG TPA: HAD-IIA family hydrolase [Pseudonocardia sp.]|nr:HAD-IIA family hydrolase [Pseudonocardia sp.]